MSHTRISFIYIECPDAGAVDVHGRSITTKAKLSIKAEKPRGAFPDYLYFGDGIRHLLAISSTQDLHQLL